MGLEDNVESESDGEEERNKLELTTALIKKGSVSSAPVIMERQEKVTEGVGDGVTHKCQGQAIFTIESYQDQAKLNNSQSLQTLVGQLQLNLIVEDVKVKINCGNRDENGNERKQSDKKERKGWKRYLGIILAITSSMMFALAILIVKKMSNYNPYSVSFWRFQGVLLPAVPIAIYYRLFKKQMIFRTIWPPFKKGHPKTIFFLFLRGLSGASAVVLQFYSLKFMSMADSSVIAFSTPVFVSLASHWFLGEKSGFIPILCGVITLGGVVVITRPPILTGGDAFDKGTLIGAGLALGCMFCATSTFLLLRYLRQMHFSVITAYFGLWGTLQSITLALSLSELQLPRNNFDWLLAGAIALLTFIGQTCITLAFKYEQAAVISLCRTCDILFAYVWQFLFLGEVPDLFSMIGGLIVIFGVFLAAFRKFVSELPEESKARKRLWILLV